MKNAPPHEKSADIFARMTRLDTLDAAWGRVRANAGCAGGDGETVAHFERRAAKRLILLAHALRRGDYRPRDLRVLHIPKRSGGTRPLAIPSVEDRVAQTACAQTLTPLLEPGFSAASFAFRPGRGVNDAVRAVTAWRKRGFTHVVEADIVRCFERIPQAPLLDRLDAALAGELGAEAVLSLVGLWLEQAGAVLDTPGTGLPQGSPLSPLLANLYLDALDDALEGRGVRIVRYADDFLLLCRGAEAAHQALARAAGTLAAHGLELRGDRSRVVDFDRGFEFLGHLFVRSMVLRRVADPEEDPVETLRMIARDDTAAAAAAAQDAALEADETAKGYDRGERVLHLAGRDRRLTLRNLSFAVTDGDGEDAREVIAVAHSRVDRIEIGPDATADFEAVRHALATETGLAVLAGDGATLGWLTPPDALDRAGLHLSQARVALDPAMAADLARRIVAGRIANQRSQLHRLNREARDPEVLAAAAALGRVLRKLPGAATAAALRGHEGEAGALYWPALGRLTAIAPQPFRRTRPARDPLNAAVNWLTAMLGRDVRAALMRRGLHPGFGVLHSAADGGEACVWDMMEGFRAPLTEGLAVALFNQGRLRPEHFAPNAEGATRIAPAGRAALIRGYETAAGRLVTSPHSGRRRTWRILMQEEAGALAAHCRDPAASPFAPHVMKH